MMEERREEIDANLKRAAESLRAASTLFTAGHFDFVASRAYYAAFYAATAVLLSLGLDFGKHSGVISAIHREFVSTGKLSKEHGRILNWLFELRGVGDYGETRHVTKEDAEVAVRSAEDFVRAIREFVSQG